MSTAPRACPRNPVLALLSFTAACSLVLVACAGGGGDAPSETRRQTFQVGGAPSLSIDLQSGALRLVPGPDGAVTVEAVLRDAPKVTYGVTQNGDSIAITSTVAGASLTDVLSFRVSRGVDLTITAPAATTVEFKTLTGGAELRGLASSGSLSSGRGDISLLQLEGKYAATTNSGDIRVEEHDGSLELETKNGDVDILESSGTFQARTAYGRMAFSGSIAAGGANHLESADGRVFVTLLAARDLNVEASGDSIDLSAPESFRTTTRQGNRVAGVIGSGATPVTIRSSRGSLDLKITE